MVVVNGQEGAEYDGIAEHYRSLSPDGKRVAYVALKDAKMLVVVDGQEGPEYDAIDKATPVFSPDGKRVVYRAQKGEKKLVVVDGQEGPEYHWIGTLSFSPGDVLEYPAVKENSFYRIRYGPSLR